MRSHQIACPADMQKNKGKWRPAVGGGDFERGGQRPGFGTAIDLEVDDGGGFVAEMQRWCELAVANAAKRHGTELQRSGFNETRLELVVGRARATRTVDGRHAQPV